MQENKQISFIMVLEFFSTCQERLMEVTYVQFCSKLREMFGKTGLLILLGQ